MCFHGSRCAEDWETDLDNVPQACPPDFGLSAVRGAMHRGFVNQYRHCRAALHRELSRLLDEEAGLDAARLRVVVCGHSLGAAMAQVALPDLAWDWARARLGPGFHNAAHNVFVGWFVAAPVVCADPAARLSVEACVGRHNMVRQNVFHDPVPKLPALSGRVQPGGLVADAARFYPSFDVCDELSLGCLAQQGSLLTCWHAFLLWGNRAWPWSPLLPHAAVVAGVAGLHHGSTRMAHDGSFEPGLVEPGLETLLAHGALKEGWKSMHAAAFDFQKRSAQLILVAADLLSPVLSALAVLGVVVVPVAKAARWALKTVPIDAAMTALEAADGMMVAALAALALAGPWTHNLAAAGASTLAVVVALQWLSLLLVKRVVGVLVFSRCASGLPRAELAPRRGDKAWVGLCGAALHVACVLATAAAFTLVLLPPPNVAASPPHAAATAVPPLFPPPAAPPAAPGLTASAAADASWGGGAADGWARAQWLAAVWQGLAQVGVVLYSKGNMCAAQLAHLWCVHFWSQRATDRIVMLQRQIHRQTQT